MPATGPPATRSRSAAEVEAKLAVDALFAMPDLRGLPGVSSVVALPDAVLEATYFDTPDLGLLDAGITLRHRMEPQAPPGSPGTWTLKLPGQAGGLALERSELTWEGPADAIPAEAISLTRARVRRAVLRPVAELRTRRCRYALMGPDGLPAVELDDDAVTVHGGRGDGRAFRELEVEISEQRSPTRSAGSASAARTLVAAVERLQAAGASPEGDRPKLSRALGPPAGKRPARQSARLGPPSTVADVVRACVGEALRTLVVHDAGIRLGAGTEHVHRARIATRRLRSELRLLRPELDPEWERRVRSGLKRLGQVLGAVRDADVAVAGLQDAIAGLEPADAAAAGTLLDRLVREREAAVKRLRAELDGESYLDLLDELASAAVAPQLVRDAAEARDVLPALVAAVWKRARTQVRRLPSVAPADEALHELRKRAKHVRYAAERAAPVLGGHKRKRAAKLARRAKGLQDVLGQFHDAGVRDRWLRAQKGLEPAESLAAGELIAAAVEDRQRPREAWPAEWEAARRAWRRFDKARSG